MNSDMTGSARRRLRTAGAAALAGAMALSAALATATPAAAVEIVSTQTFAPAPQQTFTVPEDATGLQVTVAGAQGATRAFGLRSGGAGGTVTLDLGTDYNGQTLNLLVGGVNRAGSGTSGSYLATDSEFIAIAGGGGITGFYGSTAPGTTNGGVLPGGAGGFATDSANGADGTQFRETNFSGLGAVGAVAGASGYSTSESGPPVVASAPASVVDRVISPSSTQIFLGSGGDGFASGGSARGDGIVPGFGPVRGGGGGGSGYLAPGLVPISTGPNETPAGSTTRAPGFITFTWTVQAVSALELEKSGALSDENDNGVADVGETIAYSFTVSNTGETDLFDVAVVDPRVTGISPAVDLVIGAEAVFTADPYVVTQADVDAGEVLNSAFATSTDIDGVAVSSPAAEHSIAVAAAAPALAVEKIATLADIDGDGRADAGEQIVYSFAVENTGNVTLTDVVVVDAMIAALLPAPLDALAPGESQVVVAEPYTVTEADAAAGDIVNRATVTAVSPDGTSIGSGVVFATTETDPAAAVTPAPGTPAAQAGLASTGTTAGIGLAGAVALLALGAVLLVLRQRRILSNQQ